MTYKIRGATPKDDSNVPRHSLRVLHDDAKLQTIFKPTSKTQKMTPNEFNRLLKANEAALKKAIQRDLPVKIGDTAVYHFRDNFRAGGFVNKKVWYEITFVPHR